MMIRKLFAAAAIGALALFPAACGDSDSTAPTTTTATPTTTTTTAPTTTTTTVPSTPAASVPTVPGGTGDGSVVPCEGTICTNPNHGAGPDPEGNGGDVMENPNGDGSVVPCEGTVCTNPNNGAG